ncbi:large ribosomal subunit protein bL32m-like [Haliotis cracherodii]|uniref:large ribosomal subunit protein bL32m-like n=1 Tax=Haliotis cracherodii TaxID=6455 RepID=UPI0039EBE30A
MATTTSMTRILARLQHSKQLILQWLFRNQPPGMYGALAFDVSPSLSDTHQTKQSPTSVLGSILDSVLWATVPRNRRSVEKRLTRKHGMTKQFEAAIPKKNIIACLECGHWHEKHTICGNCYKKVKAETRELKLSMGDDFHYNTPRAEIQVLYQQETDQRQKYNGKYIIEMDKPRPQWFPRNLMTRGKGDT